MAQNMSDSQVLEYVKDGIRQGKEQKQLASELARRGVTKEQATRVSNSMSSKTMSMLPMQRVPTSMNHAFVRK